jgi:hypothetical protein
MSLIFQFLLDIYIIALSALISGFRRYSGFAGHFCLAQSAPQIATDITFFPSHLLKYLFLLGEQELQALVLIMPMLADSTGRAPLGTTPTRPVTVKEAIG